MPPTLVDVEPTQLTPIKGNVNSDSSNNLLNLIIITSKVEGKNAPPVGVHLHSGEVFFECLKVSL